MHNPGTLLLLHGSHGFYHGYYYHDYDYHQEEETYPSFSP